MIRLWPRSLAGRTTVVLLAAVVLSNALALLIIADDRIDLLTSARGRQLVEQVAAAAPLLDETAVRDRRRLAWALSRPGAWLLWAEQPLATAADSTWLVRPMRRALVAHLGAESADRLRIEVRPLGAADRAAVERTVGPGPHYRRRDRQLEGWGDVPMVVGSLRLGDGSWLNFAAPAALLRPFWATPSFLTVVGTTTLVLLVAVWAVRAALRPLRLLAAAAERLGQDLDAPPIASDGPLEVSQAAEAFNRMQDRLRRLVNDRSQMLAALSHDLRTPLTRLRLRAELIEDPEIAHKTRHDLAEMEAMLAATLAFGRDDVVGEAVQTLDLAVLLQTVCEEHQDTGAEVTYAGPSHLPCPGRPSGLKRAFTNLIGNAVRYGGAAAVTVTSEDDRVTVAVVDNGPGIPDHELEKVFQPFYRLERSRSRETGGVGLGLAVVRTVIAAHGGEVTLENRAEGGLRATVVLPRPPASRSLRAG